MSGSKVSAHMDLLSQTWVRPEKTLPMQKTVDWNSEPMRKWFKTKGYAVYDMAEIDEEFKNLLLQLCAAEKNFVSDEGSRVRKTSIHSVHIHSVHSHIFLYSLSLRIG